MKILMVHPHDLWYDPWTIRILELARGVQRRGHQVQLCHMPRKEQPNHAPIRRPEDGDPPIHALQPRQQHVIPNSRLLATLAKECDLIHLQKSFASVSLPLLWIARRLNKPLHYDWDDHETAIARQVEPRFFARLQLAVYETWLPHFATTISYASQALKTRALRCGFPSERLYPIPVGADTERFHPALRDKSILAGYGLDPEAVTVLYLGQLEGAAHASRLVEAAPLVLERASKIQFLFAGGGEQLEALRQQAQTSPARDALKIAGYIPYEKVPGIVGAADICVACFDDDEASQAKSPLKIAEYLAAGKAIVASRVGEAPWMVEGCGEVVPPQNAAALADGILRYALDQEKRQRDGEKARQRALDYFTWERGTETLMHAYLQTQPSPR
ncbi:MAG: glycosyltransferase family 4 protein [bacterium]|nr:glycosyltransferase family 4 protein [bacterium]